jgi:DNA repair protein RadA/Sms
VTATAYQCQGCNAVSPRWIGFCPNCRSYNSYVMQAGASVRTVAPVALADVHAPDVARYDTGFEGVNEVLGGGFPEGGLILLGGDPGVGKSTLTLQVCASLAANGQVLYVAAEEPATQIKQRADRLRVSAPALYLLCENSLDAALGAALEARFIVIDSIQTVTLDRLSAEAGSPKQVKACVLELMKFAKARGCAALIISHVTKSKKIAGPRALEHMVDTVLYFAGEEESTLRVLSCKKNRYGPSNIRAELYGGSNGFRGNCSDRQG